MDNMKTCFKKVDYDLTGLLNGIEMGDIGLPDIQRPFVWKNTRVRDLFDSMYKGFPVGLLLFWENNNTSGIKDIGIGKKQHVPHLLIIDGQQRLTSLYAVFKGKKVKNQYYKEYNIEIAFNPRLEKFEVTDATIRKNPEWIANISELWATGKAVFSVIKDYLKKIREKTEIDEEEEDRIAHNLDRLFDVQKYPFTALEISSIVDEENVSDIFVRINSEGVQLNQADFILTLMSVYWDEGRAALEEFSRLSYIPVKQGDQPSPFNHLICPSPDNLLRVAIALGFFRSRLRSVYQVLRGKDLQTNEYSDELRDSQFLILKDAQEKVTNLSNWHLFISCLVGIGFRNGSLISSKNNLMYTYAFYLIGKYKYHVSQPALEKMIGRWFYFVTLTGRYTSSPEFEMEKDLVRLKEINDADVFAAFLEQQIAERITPDYWTITLPSLLETSSAQNAMFMAYIATLIRLNSPVLYSYKKVIDLFEPGVNPVKKPVELHHLFPRAYLEKQGIKDLKLINQVGNYAYIEWPQNVSISDSPPEAYVPKMKEIIPDSDWGLMQQMHALPENWHLMDYREFLKTRRFLIAQVIKMGFEELK